MFQLYSKESIEQDYKRAKDLYDKFGIDVDAALKHLADFKISMHCWKGDNVAGL